MPEDARPDQPQSEWTNQGQSSRGSARLSGHEGRSDCCDDWRCCEPPPYCGPAPPYWDPYCGPPPYHGWPHHHWRHGWPPPMPGGDFFEAMMRFAASTAGFRGRWWREMADAARYAQRDYCDPCAPPWSYCDPCPPHHGYCEPCPPPWSHSDSCPPRHECHGDSEPSDAINLKELRATLEAGKEHRLKDKKKALEEANERHDTESVHKLTKELAYETAKADAAIDTVIHDVKLARVAEAMRRKKWSRGARHGGRY